MCLILTMNWNTVKVGTGTVVFTKEMCADVISIDDNTLAQKFLFLENFAVAYDTDTLFVSDI